jgi:hypothetical protein
MKYVLCIPYTSVSQSVCRVVRVRTDGRLGGPISLESNNLTLINLALARVQTRVWSCGILL